MDPLSTVVSGFAVVSLAIQLAGTVQDIHRFLRGISAASKELERLVELLEQLHCMLDGIRALHSKQKEQDNIPDMHPSVMGGLVSCQGRIELLENIVDKVKNDLNRNRKISKTWSSLQLTLRKKDVDEVESRLEKAMNTLQMAMTMNIAHVQLSHAQTTATIASGVSLLNSSLMRTTTTTAKTDLLGGYQASLANDKDIATKPSSCKRPIRLKQRQLQMDYYYPRKTPFGTFIYRTASEYKRWRQEGSATSCSEANTNETIFAFLPWFFNRCVELRIRKDYGIISPTLTTYPIFERAGNLSIFEACRTGDVEALKAAFSIPGVLPSMVDEFGRSLLHRAAHYNQAEVCRFLLQLGLDPDYVDWSGTTPLTDVYEAKDSTYESSLNARLVTRCSNLWKPQRQFHPKSSTALMETLDVVVSYGKTDLTAMNFLDYLKWVTICPPEAFEFVLNQERVEEHISDFGDWGIYALLDRVLERFAASQNKIWRRLVRRILNIRVSVIKGDYRKDIYSLLNTLFKWASDPDESRALGCDWLEILSSSGVDIHNYLETKLRQYHGSPPLVYDGYLDFNIGKRQLIFDLGENPSVYWDWWIDPNEPAALVCEEFKAISCHNQPGHDLSPTSNWPYNFPLWHLDDVNQKLALNWPPLVRSMSILDEREKCASLRYERKMRKKSAKQRKAMGFGKELKMPGTWIE